MPEEKPVVVLTVGRLLDRVVRYKDACEEAGLEVRVVSPAHQSAETVESWMGGAKGLLLSGGGDIDPDALGAEPHPTVSDIDPERDSLEKAALEYAWRRDMPVLAICRGMQVLNWVLGGTLHPDIDQCVGDPGEKKHRQTEYGKERHEIGHEIEVFEGTRLADIMGPGRLEVNTLHHQALDRIADPLRVSAVSPEDGIVEGVEAPDRSFVVGVQYHPECMVHHHPDQRKLFHAFARAVACAPGVPDAMM